MGCEPRREVAWCGVAEVTRVGPVDPDAPVTRLDAVEVLGIANVVCQGQRTSAVWAIVAMPLGFRGLADEMKLDVRQALDDLFAQRPLRDSLEAFA